MVKVSVEIKKSGMSASTSLVDTAKHSASTAKVMAIGLLLTTLLAMAISPTPAGAAVTSGKAYDWGDNYFGQLGNGNTGTDSDVPVAVKNLSNVKNVDGGYEFSVAATQ